MKFKSYVAFAVVAPFFMGVSAGWAQTSYNIPAHWHPAVERVTVISGTFNMGVGDKLDKQKSTALPPGHMMILQAKTNHFAWTKEEVVVQLNGTGPWGVTYVNSADDPRKK